MTGYRARIGMLAGAALVALGMLGPPAALATGSHHLQMYKVEKHVTMDGDFESLTLSCNKDDYAMDGMWRIDHVDQDNDFAGNVLTTVRVYDSYGDATDPGRWHFSFAKETPGDAQLKVFLTCLGNVSAPNTHQHGLEISDQFSFANLPVPATGNDVPVPAAAPYFFQYPPAGAPTSNLCTAPFAPGWNYGTSSLLVAPGFHIPSDEDGEHALQLAGSYPLGLSGPKQNTWTWRFQVLGTGSQLDLNWRCLRIRSDLGTTTHSHKIVNRMRYGSNRVIPADRVKEQKVECAEHYKGMVGGFWFGHSSEQYLWWLGMDPRPKERAYRFLNLDPLNAHQVDLSLLCFNDRTS